MTLLICPVRPGCNNPELRYALRSWEANLHLPGGLDLITVGYKPDWLSPDHHIEGNFYTSVPLAVWDNIRLGAEFAASKAKWKEDVVFMNDDFFCLDPVGSILPVKRDVSLAEHAAKSGTLWWGQSLRLTASWLADRGYPSPDSYEVHRPLVANPHDMVSALDQWDGGFTGPIPQWRTLYGVLNKVDAHPVADCKLGAGVTGVGSPWVSTSDQSWRRYAVWIKDCFQKPSRWEI